MALSDSTLGDDHGQKTVRRELTTMCAWCGDTFKHRVGKDMMANADRRSQLETERDEALAYARAALDTLDECTRERDEARAELAAEVDLRTAAIMESDNLRIDVAGLRAEVARLSAPWTDSEVETFAAALHEANISEVGSRKAYAAGADAVRALRHPQDERKVVPRGGDIVPRCPDCAAGFCVTHPQDESETP